MADNLETVTQIIHKDRVTNKETLVAFIMGQPNLMPKDAYMLLTHKTEFNEEQKSDIPPGEYVVTGRKWSHHLANPWRIMLKIYITDIE